MENNKQGIGISALVSALISLSAILIIFAHNSLEAGGDGDGGDPTPTPTPTPTPFWPTPTPTDGPCPGDCGDPPPGSDPSKTGGWVICCDADEPANPENIQECVKNPPPGDHEDDDAIEARLRCTFAHEENHRYYPLTVCEDGYGAGPGGSYTNLTECQAYTLEAQCLYAAAEDCAARGDMDCANELRRAWSNIQNEANRICNEMPLPPEPWPTQIPTPTPSPTATPDDDDGSGNGKD